MAESLRALEINPYADKYHQAGLEAELSKDFIGAYANFNNADRVLNDESKTVRTVDTQIQLARIERDYGFTFVREALHVSNEIGKYETRFVFGSNSSDDVVYPYLESARGHLYGSKGSTDSMIKELKGDKPNPRLLEAKADIFAEHGATLSLLGRLATAGQIMLIEGDPNCPEYLKAHNYLKQGNNGYYLVSNAMTAARHERINSNTSESLSWLVKAGQGIFWAARHDRFNLKAATLTAGKRTLDLLTRSRAIESVYTKP